MEAQQKTLQRKIEQEQSQVQSGHAKQLQQAREHHQHEVSALERRLLEAEARASQAKEAADEVGRRLKALELSDSSLMKRLEEELKAATRTSLRASELSARIEEETGLGAAGRRGEPAVRSAAGNLPQLLVASGGIAQNTAKSPTLPSQTPATISASPPLQHAASAAGKTRKGKGKSDAVKPQTPKQSGIKRRVVIEIVPTLAQSVSASVSSSQPLRRPSSALDKPQQAADISLEDPFKTTLKASGTLIDSSIPQPVVPMPAIPLPVVSKADGYESDHGDLAAEVSAAINAARMAQELQERSRAEALARARRDLMDLQSLLLI